jgi:uncharacterized membrane protein
MNTKIISLFVLSICGLLFSGYMSAIKFFSGTCVFNEPCPYFLGFPACYYGFAMFLLLSLSSFALLIRYMDPDKMIRSILTISTFGILFAGYFTLKEIPVLLTKGFSEYLFGLPTCAVGLIFYISVFIVAFFMYNKQARQV